VAVSAEHRCAGQAPHRGKAGKPGAQALSPGTPARIEERAAAQCDVLLGEHHLQAARAENMRGGEPRGARADHQHIGVIVHGLGRSCVIADERLEPAQARSPADQRLVEPLPGPARRHESLVVKARRQEAGDEIVERQHITPERRPAVLALGHEALV